MFASLTDDQGEEARRYAEFVLRVQAQAAAADAPRTAYLQPAREALEAKGYTWTLTEVVATAYGDTTARRRVVALAWRSDVPPARREVYNLTKDLVFPEGTPCAHIMVPAAKVCTEWWLTPDQGVLTLDPRMPRRGGPLDAIPVGHFCGNASKTNEVVYSGRGPLPSLRTGAWLRNPGTRVLIHQPEGQGTCVRPLLPVEAWRAHGGEAGPWTKCINAETEAGSGKNTMERLLDTGGEQHTLALWALRASPREWRTPSCAPRWPPWPRRIRGAQGCARCLRKLACGTACKGGCGPGVVIQNGPARRWPRQARQPRRRPINWPGSGRWTLRIATL